MLLALTNDSAQNERNKSVVHLCSRMLSILGDILCTQGNLLLKQASEETITPASACIIRRGVYFRCQEYSFAPQMKI